MYKWIDECIRSKSCDEDSSTQQVPAVGSPLTEPKFQVMRVHPLCPIPYGPIHLSVSYTSYLYYHIPEQSPESGDMDEEEYLNQEAGPSNPSASPATTSNGPVPLSKKAQKRAAKQVSPAPTWVVNKLFRMSVHVN